MRLSRKVRELLQLGDDRALAELAAGDPRAWNPLVGRLWDPDAAIRCRAARTIGRAAAARPERGLEVIRRLMWALNDESGTHGVYAVAALGEIGRHAPGVLEPFLGALVALARDEGLRLEVLKALEAAAEAAPRTVANHLTRLEPWIDASRADERQAFERLIAAARKGTDHGE